ncbi:MAG: DUF4199 domain-containing protein [Bacteroidetes bacterium]|jgi:hypothetical protein|nr:DUF4199 domain-containing protein [Bacteroidota bacterium]
MKPLYLHGITAGVLLGMVAMVVSPGMTQAFEMETQNPGGFWIWLLRTAIISFGMYMVIRSKKQNIHYLSFGQVFKSAYATGLVALGAYIFTMAVYYYAVNPNWFPYTADQLTQIMEEKLDGTDMDIDLIEPTIVWMVSHINSLVLFSMAFLNIFGYAALSVVFATAMSKDDPSDIKL